MVKKSKKPSIVAGDIVKLKSGGPDMTVDLVCGTGELVCVWFLNGIERSTNFNPESLKLVKKRK